MTHGLERTRSFCSKGVVPSLSHDASLISAQLAHICRMHYSHEQTMLTEIYIEALLVDKQLADRAWQAWVGVEWQILIFAFISL